MTYDFQVTIDSADPHPLADWWAEAIGWTVEPADEEFIRRMVAEGRAREEDTTTHRGRLVWSVGAAIRHPESGRRILFQRVPEAKTVKNRVHLDVRVGDEKREAEVERLVAAGAKVLYRGSQGPFTWVTVADPEGNEFCLT
ncbi:VOC family protein [Amycolatopsis acidicola]|uniref:VOC family protein n=1 Tax=Amycolatopsis acidicola TaxID=2596893 RepID=A0A5N0V6N7_9PSEU|nr:VOC family protein [Amycolatopsis acidicola]KAA9161394.1 VOC family protein [Amycolatopsis acidicola]